MHLTLDYNGHDYEPTLDTSGTWTRHKVLDGITSWRQTRGDLIAYRFSGRLRGWVLTLGEIASIINQIPRSEISGALEDLLHAEEIRACDHCDEWSTEWRPHHSADVDLCETCWNAQVMPCDRCEDTDIGASYGENGGNPVLTDYGYQHWCSNCWEHYTRWCENCVRMIAYDTDCGCREDCECPVMYSPVVTRDNGTELHEMDNVSVMVAENQVNGLLVTRRLYSAAYEMHEDDKEAHYLARREIFNLLHTGAVELVWRDDKNRTFVKRFRQALHKRSVTFPDKVWSDLGAELEREARGVEAQAYIDGDLNKEATEFFHDDSCWWQDTREHNQSRCTAKNHGVFGLITTNEGGWLQGRSFVAPLHRLNRFEGDRALEAGPIEAEGTAPVAWAVFNEYGDQSEGVGARLWAQILGDDWTVGEISAPSFQGYLNTSGWALVHRKDDEPLPGMFIRPMGHNCGS